MFVVKIFDLVGFAPYAKKKIYIDYANRLNWKQMLFPVPKYIYLSRKFLFFFLKRAPQLKDLYYPIQIDIFLALGFKGLRDKR